MGFFFFCGFSVVFKSGKLVLSEASLVLWIVSFSALSVKWDIQGRGRERGDHREDVQLCKDDSSYSLVTIKAQMPSNAPSLNPFTRLTFSEETKTLSEFVSQVSVLSLPVFTITFLKFILFFLLIFCVHRRAHLLLCDKHTAPPPRHCVNRAAFFTFLTSLLHFTHCTSPFRHEFSSHLLLLCLCLHCAALHCSPRKWRQPRMEHGSGQRFAHTQLHTAAAKESLEICVLMGHGCSHAHVAQMIFGL